MKMINKFTYKEEKSHEKSHENAKFSVTFITSMAEVMSLPDLTLPVWLQELK
jgi:hypothetical protein